jgi:hypothetical protein
VEDTDLLMMNQHGVDRLASDKLTFGGDVSAAIGPVASVSRASPGPSGEAFDNLQDQQVQVSLREAVLLAERISCDPRTSRSTTEQKASDWDKGGFPRERRNVPCVDLARLCTRKYNRR